MRSRKYYLFIASVLLLCLFLTVFAVSCENRPNDTEWMLSENNEEQTKTQNGFPLDEKEVREEQIEIRNSSKISAETTETTALPKKRIVLDPGHASRLTGEYEPVGPGSSETKMAMVIGTRGVQTGLYEYELVLTLCQKLRTELVNRGYEVSLTREDNDTLLSNMERAQMANELNADIFLRIHADASDDRQETGALSICISPDNPYVPEQYPASRLLSEYMLEEYCSVTGFESRGVRESDSMAGNNWSLVPTVLFELGMMTNPEEDAKMADALFQEKMVQGMANGIDRYFAEKLPSGG